MAKEEYYLFTFESTHAAIATDKLLKPVGSMVMPVPRFISSSCGISVRIRPEVHEEAEALFREKSTLQPCISDDEDCDFHYYRITIEDGNPKYEIIKIK